VFARKLLCLLPCLALPWVASTPGLARELGGTVVLYDEGGKRRLTGAEVASAVVYFEPDKVTAVTPGGPYVMTTKGKEFQPRVLPIPKGGKVSFPNEDPILHNVFSLSPGNRFDLGLYRKGPGKVVTFNEPGLVRVFCNVHHAMVAYVLVLATPYFGHPDEQGRFRLTVPTSGAGTLHVWHERSDPFSQRLTLPFAGRIEARLEINKPRIPPHLNKQGKAYARGPEY
jgi:hypothetical protein